MLYFEEIKKRKIQRGKPKSKEIDKTPINENTDKNKMHMSKKRKDNIIYEIAKLGHGK